MALWAPSKVFSDVLATEFAGSRAARLSVILVPVVVAAVVIVHGPGCGPPPRVAGVLVLSAIVVQAAVVDSGAVVAGVVLIAAVCAFSKSCVTVVRLVAIWV